MSNIEALWNALTPAAEALAADRAALADPRADGSAVDEVARFLANMLEYEYAVYRKTLRSAARKLLTEFGGSKDDLWDVMEARARDVRWLQGVIRRNVSPWLVVQDFIGDYARQVEQQRKREAASAAWAEHAVRSQAALAERQAEEVADQGMWGKALVELALQMCKSTFDTWLKNTRLLSQKDGVMIVGVQNSYAKDWLESRLLSMIKRTLVECGVQNAEVKFEVMK